MVAAGGTGYLPSEEELRAEIERERELVVRERMERYGAEEYFELENKGL